MLSQSSLIVVYIVPGILWARLHLPDKTDILVSRDIKLLTLAGRYSEFHSIYFQYYGGLECGTKLYCNASKGERVSELSYLSAYPDAIKHVVCLHLI